MAMRIFTALLVLLTAYMAIGLTPHGCAQTETGGGMTADPVMPADRFWELIGRTVKYEADQDAQINALRQELGGLSAAEIETFERAFQEQQRRAYSWDLWGAAYVMNGGASDDGFEYFQRWLISKGRKIFEAALADPDSLATMITTREPEDLYDFELFAYVAREVWEEKTGLDADRFPYTGAPPAAQPAGEPFAEDPDHLAKRYPKLWARFGMSPR
jgi:hypothetical protein